MDQTVKTATTLLSIYRYRLKRHDEALAGTGSTADLLPYDEVLAVMELSDEITQLLLERNETTETVH